MTLRRDFLKQSAIAALAGRVGLAQSASKRIDEFDAANTKVAHRVTSRISDDDIAFLKQIGMRWARVEFGAGDSSFDAMRATQERFTRQGIRIFSGVHPAYRSVKVQLGQPGRDQDIETYRTFIRDLGRLGIPVASYDFHPGNTYTTSMVERRGYKTREFKLEDFRNKVEKQMFEREYSADEIWANYTYLVKAILPVAEEAKVKLALHPDDPPLAKMNGVAKIFTHYDGYHRAEEISGGSRYWGLTFCVGTWSEGGDKMGKNVFEMIRDFGSRGKLFEIHFRSVTSPLPNFVETFPDEGYMDMYQVMKALREVRFDGAVEPDHVPQLIGDTGVQRAGTAYCVSYIRSLLRRANEEVG